jgi:hypothetical protein
MGWAYSGRKDMPIRKAEDILDNRAIDPAKSLRQQILEVIEQAQREALEESAAIALAIDSGRGNESFIVDAICRLIPKREEGRE